MEVVWLEALIDSPHRFLVQIKWSRHRDSIVGLRKTLIKMLLDLKFWQAWSFFWKWGGAGEDKLVQITLQLVQAMILYNPLTLQSCIQHLSWQVKIFHFKEVLMNGKTVLEWFTLCSNGCVSFYWQIHCTYLGARREARKAMMSLASSVSGSKMNDKDGDENFPLEEEEEADVEVPKATPVCPFPDSSKF